MLLVELMRERDPDPLAPPGKSSSELRSFAILPAFDDISLTVALEQRGVVSHPVEDPSAMLRCLDAVLQDLSVGIRQTTDIGSMLTSRLIPRTSCAGRSRDLWMHGSRQCDHG